MTEFPGTRFTVLIPLYNKRPHIERALNSVFAQTLPPQEILIVDDGSSDGGYELVRSLQDSRIKLHRRDRPGPGGYAARNFGIERAAEDWIAFLDADDEWQPHHLETVARTIAMAERPEDLVCVGTGYHNVYPGGRQELDIYTRAHQGAAPAFLDFRDMISTWLLVGGSPIWTSAAACRRDALLAAGLFPADRCTRGGDKDMWFRLAAQGITAINPTVSATYYKDSVNMVTKRSSVNTRHCMCETIEEMLTRAFPVIQKPLRQVYNLEVYKYCLQAARASRLSEAAWRGFFAAESPRRFLVLSLLSNSLVDKIFRGLLRFHPRAPRRLGRQESSSNASA
ncbi:MAG TPA: glycosyltransferase family A protein [Dongiaceae bacterium]|nr:glycosyltransferase family A protein [Dongiaceae bacterium]